MLTIAVAIGSFFAFIVAYNTYGRWLSHKIFALDDSRTVPSHELRDDVDYVPTKRSVVFGHHFTSIAGTGPIVGPAIAVFWGWLPALLWVVLGSIFIGAVHDLGALVVSLRNRGQTVGEIAGRVISPRAKLLFLLILFFALSVVIAIFGLVIANIFALYPSSVLSVIVAVPVAIAVGLLVYRANVGLLWPSLAALFILYAAVYLGTYVEFLQIKLPTIGTYGTPVVLWTILLLIYCFAASVLPVWLLLQPRDYVNSHQLLVALALLVGGLVVAAAQGKAELQSAPAIAQEVPIDAPPMLPFLFITIACGACSGFHCLVSSGTTSKQLNCETDAQYVGYGSMLLEGALAVVVILACCAGVGMGVKGGTGDEQLTGRAAWQSRYQPKVVTTVNADGTEVRSGGWANQKLPQLVGAFVDGGANFVSTLGIPLALATAIIAVLVACFAATTLDTATRLQRYVIQELGASLHMPPLTNKYAATTVAVVTGGAIAMMPNSLGEIGKGGLLLWPLFGATNQLLAGLAFLVLAFHLRRRNIATWFVVAPMAMMLLMPAWAMVHNLTHDWQGNWLLMSFGIGILALEAWMIVEGLLTWRRAAGVLEPSLPSVGAMAGGGK
ncbi:carbon starvation protein A [Aeoliella sp. ICT_H6.2]|uniref:Carbon starvation protein A n=1 Tax=Aeoliella straminimaris TaxID=2954799 RepID=A0A9X2JFD1_9BACT|nr:carbon starvation protein A [Aeoliella straminimaris]MCO6042343.1 carbon starvation protein A [Aeoliella straminimaris]